jgi:hypothetical protein
MLVDSNKVISILSLFLTGLDTVYPEQLLFLLCENTTPSRADHLTTQGNCTTFCDEEVNIVDTKKEYKENSNKSDVNMEGTNDHPL